MLKYLDLQPKDNLGGHFKHFLDLKIAVFFSIWIFFHENSQFTVQQGMREAIPLPPHFHFQPLHRRLDISRTITAESSPLHIAARLKLRLAASYVTETKRGPLKT